MILHVSAAVSLCGVHADTIKSRSSAVALYVKRSACIPLNHTKANIFLFVILMCKHTRVAVAAPNRLS